MEVLAAEVSAEATVSLFPRDGAQILEALASDESVAPQRMSWMHLRRVHAVLSEF